MKEVSIVIRTWNCRDTLEACLMCLARQRFRDFEVIVVDSGSTDGTAERAAREGVRLLRISRAEFSYGGALNLGFAVAETPVVGALSAHSLLLNPDALGRMAATLKAADDRVVGVFGCAVFDDALARHPTADAVPIRVTAADLRRRCNAGFSNSCSLLWRSFWQTFPFPSERCEDQVWASHFLTQGYATLQLPAVRYRYRLDRPAWYYIRKHMLDLLTLYRLWPEAEWPRSELTSGSNVRYRLWCLFHWWRRLGWRWHRLNDEQKWFSANEMGLFLASARVRGGRGWWGVMASDVIRALGTSARRKGWFLPSTKWP